MVECRAQRGNSPEQVHDASPPDGVGSTTCGAWLDRVHPGEAPTLCWVSLLWVEFRKRVGPVGLSVAIVKSVAVLRSY